MGDDVRQLLADAVLADEEPWVLCRAVREDGEVVDFEYLAANPAAVAEVGVGPLVGHRMLELLPELSEVHVPRLAQAVGRGRVDKFLQRRLLVPDRDAWHGGWSVVEVRPAGDLVAIHWRDATQEQEARLRAAAGEARLQALLENAAEVIALFAVDGTALYVSPSLPRVLGRTQVARDVTANVHPEDRAAVREAFAHVARGRPGDVVEVEVRIRHEDGRWLWVHARGTNHVDEPDVGGIVVNLWDVTEQRTLADELRHQALHDPLTGLPNRRLVSAELEHALARTRRTGHDVALVLCDVDMFKTVNDALGHAAGDALLVAVAERLRALVRPSDSVGRLGGDEFVVVCEDVETPCDVESLLVRIREGLRGTYAVAGRDVTVTVSVGASHGRDPVSGPELLSEADTAMYAAKRAGRDRTQVYDQRVHRGHRQRMDREQAMRRALEGDELVLHYQPKVDLRTGRAVAAEALVRWQHPSDGLLPPSQFLPLAEESDLIVDLGAWVLRESLVTAAGWVHPGPTSDTDDGGLPVVNVNLSGRHLLHPDVLRHLDEALDLSGIDPSRVELEITETVLLRDLDTARRVLAAARERGVGVALDDFGTGYSSLTWLQRLPVDTVKLDRSFIADLLAPGGGAPEILDGVTSLAHALDKSVVAEGVETADQGAYLARIGCDFAQGYLYGRPTPDGPFVTRPASRTRGA